LNGIVLLQVKDVIRSVRQQRSRSREKEKAKDNWLPVAVTHDDECGMLDEGWMLVYDNKEYFLILVLIYWFSISCC
jgi:hypothetical protein